MKNVLLFFCLSILIIYQDHHVGSLPIIFAMCLQQIDYQYNLQEVIKTVLWTT